MIDLSNILKERGAGRIFCATTFGLFTNGLDNFRKAYEEKRIDHVFCTNLNYHSPELLQEPWFTEADMSKFVALLIDSMNHNATMSTLMDPSDKIRKLLAKHEGRE